MKRRQFIQALGASLTLAPLYGCVSSKIENPTLMQQKRLYIDGLSFIPDDHLDVQASQLNAYIADISAVEAVKQADGSTNYKRTYDACMKSLKQKKADILEHPQSYLLATTGRDIQQAIDEQRCAVFLQIQGADCVEQDLNQLDQFYDLGLRVLQLTHHYNNIYAGGALSQGNQGLSDKGIELIKRLEEKNMLIDLSHSSVASAEQTLKHAKGPVVQTHGAARAIINNARCTPDQVLKGIADSGGVFGVFMMSWWLTYEKVPRAEHYINHLKHIKNVAGSEAVAIANDYPLRGHLAALSSGNNNQKAIQGYQQWWQAIGQKGTLGFDREVNHIVIPELNHIKRMRSIEYLLEQAHFSSREIDQIMGENWRRVLTQVLV